MRIHYGILGNSIDVTNICLEKLTKNDIIEIPLGDPIRASYFTDNLLGVSKKIIIINNDVLTEHHEHTIIKINILDNTINVITIDDINNKIENIHSKLKLKYGNMNEELTEQKMAIMHLTGKEKVLELGGNVGRNSLLIASILENSNNLVTLETDVNYIKKLKENRDLNNFTFHIENAGLSNRKLLQKDWYTIPSDTLIEGYNWVDTITLNELKHKYNIEFDTLVLDCEGAFYYILMDMPEILNNINLIIMENDYHDITHKNYIDNMLKQNNFIRVYLEGSDGGWGPCKNNFYETWKK